jgi:hypothetical protein
VRLAHPRLAKIVAEVIVPTAGEFANGFSEGSVHGMTVRHGR